MPNHGDAFNWLDEHSADLFGAVGSMLYVGHRGDTHPWWRTTFADKLARPRLTVLDVLKGNLDTAEGLADELILGDIRSTPIAGYGLVFWDEGPEHLPKEQSLELLRVWSSQNDHVLISCPWGYQPQGSGPEDYEFHHWGPQPADFHSIGFNAEVFGIEFTGAANGHGNLIAWI